MIGHLLIWSTGLILLSFNKYAPWFIFASFFFTQLCHMSMDDLNERNQCAIRGDIKTKAYVGQLVKRLPSASVTSVRYY